MLSSYLNQTAELKTAQRDEEGWALTDNRGAVLYGAPRTIPCRRIKKEQVILTRDGRMVKVSWVYYFTDQVLPEDMLDGRLVQDVAEWIGLGGAVMGYKAVL